MTHSLRDLAKSIVSFSGAMAAFGVQQFGELLRSRDPSQSQSRSSAAFDAVTTATETELSGFWKSAFHAGRRFQDSLLDATFGLLPSRPQSVGDLVFLPIDTLNFVRATRQLVPSSTYLVEAMLDPLPLAQAELVVEFGPGTGVMTQALLRRLPDDAKVLAFEINSRFVRQLKNALPDPRLEVLEVSAESVGQVLRQRNHSRVDAVVSSLGLTIMPDALKHSIFEALMPYLDERSVLTQFQYLNAIRCSDGPIQRYDSAAFLRDFFPYVSQRTIWLNLPPVSVYTCRFR
jgi:phosphatidylethanolamine/phosphatidyl-N-methylethanolamine N-methyltransferase